MSLKFKREAMVFKNKCSSSFIEKYKLRINNANATLAGFWQDATITEHVQQYSFYTYLYATKMHGILNCIECFDVHGEVKCVGMGGWLLLLDGVQAYINMPITSTTAPAMKPDGREDATPKYGSGSVNRNTDIGTAMQILTIWVEVRNFFQDSWWRYYWWCFVDT